MKFIKRIVGMPGDRIAIKHGRVIRNGHPDTFKITPCHGGLGSCNFPRAITVPRGRYFMVGSARPCCPCASVGSWSRQHYQPSGNDERTRVAPAVGHRGQYSRAPSSPGHRSARRS